MDVSVQRINRAAAAMAVSNMGHGVDEHRVLNWTPSSRYANSPRQEVCDLAGHLIESDEHEDIFGEEAEDWAKQISEAGGLATFALQFPHHARWLTALEDI